MYFHGTLSIDPSDITDIQFGKPTKAFGKMLYYLTAGLASEREERETFTAVSILQRLNQAFHSLGIGNIVRLAKDDADLYLDTEGREDDLKEAMATLSERHLGADQGVFDSLRLVLEHEDEVLKYLIDVYILRVHEIGEHPIRVTVNGLMKELRSVYYSDDIDKTQPDVRDRLGAHFASQKKYDKYVSARQSHFDCFLDRIEEALRTRISVDTIQRTSESRVIRPSKPVQEGDQWAKTYDSDPVYADYYGVDDYFFYTWIWSDMTHQRDIYCHNCSVVDEQGQTVFDVGDHGFHAGGSNTMNPRAEFELPSAEDLQVHGDNAYEHDIAATAAAAEGTTESQAVSQSASSGGETRNAGDASEGGWFSSLFGGSDEGGGGWFSGVLGDSSDGGGCGGGCGGCGGGE